MTVFWVALGGAFGSVARYLLSGGINGRFYPWGTVLINIVGSFALGYLVGKWGWEATTPQRFGVTAGLLGGFTTFSAFSLDVVTLWENGSAFLQLPWLRFRS
jgi:CrcB protein